MLYCRVGALGPQSGTLRGGEPAAEHVVPMIGLQRVVIS